MRRALGITMMFLAMFSIAGGHWAVLQTVAWTQMLRQYTAESGLLAGVSQTFSGERPCKMCKSIETNRAQEEKAPATLKVDKKAEVFLCSFRDVLCNPPFREFAYPSLAEVLLVPRDHAPPTPVPIVRGV